MLSIPLAHPSLRQWVVLVLGPTLAFSACSQPDEVLPPTPTPAAAPTLTAAPTATPAPTLSSELLDVGRAFAPAGGQPALASGARLGQRPDRSRRRFDRI